MVPTLEHCCELHLKCLLRSPAHSDTTLLTVATVLVTLVLSGWTGLPGRLRDGASEGLGELRTHLAEDRILPCWGKPRWKDPNTSPNITQLRSLQPRRQVMSWTEVGLESDTFKSESLLLNQLAIRFWTNHLNLPSWGFLTYKMTLMLKTLVRIK